MFKLAVYGKGGIGKSTISSNLSYLLSKDGSKVLHVGCDPKHDSTRLLTHGVSIRPFSSDTSIDPVNIGINNISCVECGGADPGKGCAGKGMELLFSHISDIDADYRVCDVLGDVVCGGFSIPARKQNADAILIVTSGEFMSLYAANNILKGLMNINPGRSVMGLVFNRRGDVDEDVPVKRFSEATGIPIVCDVPRSKLFADAESTGEVLSALFPESDETKMLQDLCDLVRSNPERFVPRPLSEQAMMDIAAGRPISEIQYVKNDKKDCKFDNFDAERNLTFVGEFVMPACTSHGAADGAMRILDAAVIMHGPRNCAYLMEYAFRRRVLNGSSERSYVPDPGIYSTNLDADEAFKDSGIIIEDAVIRAKNDGYRYMFLISTCSSEIMGTDMVRIARNLSEKHSVDVIPVEPDSTFLSSKFGGTIGLFDALICRMRPKEVEKGTVNLIARWFYGVGKNRSMDALQHILSKLDLRIRFGFLDFCTMAEIEDFCTSEYDIQLGNTDLNKRVSDRLTEVTGRRAPLQLDIPVGLKDCLEWVDKLAEYAPELSGLADDAKHELMQEFDDIIAKYRPLIQSKKVVIFCVMVRDLDWQVDMLKKMGADIEEIMFVDGPVIDHNVHIPDYGETKVSTSMRMCDLKQLDSKEKIDLVITNDGNRVAREGFRHAPLGTRYYGMDGIDDWARIVTDSLKVFNATWEDGL